MISRKLLEKLGFEKLSNEIGWRGEVWFNSKYTLWVAYTDLDHTCWQALEMSNEEFLLDWVAYVEGELNEQLDMMAAGDDW